MAQEAVTIASPTGDTAPGAAEDVVRYSDGFRIATATLYILGGLAGAAACIIVPGLHLITTWGLPLLGFILGVRTFRRRIIIHDIAGECPHCGERFELHGGSVDDIAWQKCPHCGAALSFTLASAEAAANP